MKPVKEENGGSGVAAILDRMARELSGEVPFAGSEGVNHAPIWGWAGRITGRRKSKDPEARVCLLNLRNNKCGRSPVSSEDGAEHHQGLVIQGKVRTSESPLFVLGSH